MLNNESEVAEPVAADFEDGSDGEKRERRKKTPVDDEIAAMKRIAALPDGVRERVVQWSHARFGS